MGKIFMLIGKSATGKDLIYRSVLRAMPETLAPLVLYTTRPMREGEKDGREYHFTDYAALAALRAKGKVIEERVYHTVHGDWYYFTADDGQTASGAKSRLMIGTLAAYQAMRRYFGEGRVCPLYIEVSDENRLKRAVAREAAQKAPVFAEVCRRYLADEEDFSREKLAACGIRRAFANDGAPEECVSEVTEAIKEECKESMP